MPKLDLSWMHQNEHAIEVDAHEPQFVAGPSPTEKSFWIDCLPFSEIPLFYSVEVQPDVVVAKFFNFAELPQTDFVAN